MDAIDNPHTTPAMIHRATSRITLAACLVLAALVSACGGGGGADPGPVAAPVVASSPAPSAVSPPAASASLPGAAVPDAATATVLAAASDCVTDLCAGASSADPLASAAAATLPESQGYLVASTEVTTAEHQYPDLRALPTLVVPFEPVVVGDVSTFAVAPAKL